ncbi:helix-turn-helix transcriptional regulator [Natrarchaeobius oligotrophus]|uniref:Transcriptional regulator n=1 Tax=Natrarchaeobius chitinivorans TaxID=1679083 RepID=A0A3N6MLJ8_NATCH|nr:helix-turn-helix transcriptional regulator [Natrarchaeobius chitinivorans]RQG98190.1 transcriptional regulator [Natrarchaeobius chitinivorans]
MALVDERKVDVLVYLYENGPGTGYSIAASDDVEYTKGYIYDVLGELEDEGMIEVADRESEGRKRVTYQLTENGTLLLRALDRVSSKG